MLRYVYHAHMEVVMAITAGEMMERTLPGCRPQPPCEDARKIIDMNKFHKLWNEQIKAEHTFQERQEAKRLGLI